LVLDPKQDVFETTNRNFPGCLNLAPTIPFGFLPCIVRHG